LSTTIESGLGARFAARKAEGRAALVPYVTAGYPSRDESLELLLALAEAGADVLEVGIPFSDPLADGPVIQRASFKALEAGMTVRGVLDVVRDFRRQRDEPVVLFTYLNPVLHFGVEAFSKAAVEAGAQGLLLTDLPAGADPDMEAMILEHGLDPIRLLAPTTPPARVPDVVRGGRGFLYYISRTGVTGARTELRSELGREVAALRELVTLPIAVGFGISTPAQAAAVAAVADGVVVGSALTQKVDEAGVEGVAEFGRSLRAAMDEGREAAG
jgi:tryptophan synthase alpha chain